MKKEDRGPVVVRPPGSSVAIPVGRDTDLARVAQECFQTIATDTYTGDDLKYLGMSRIEAAIFSLAEDAPTNPEARREFLDRAMGKPTQKVNTTSVTVDLTGLMQQFAEEDERTGNGCVEEVEGESSLLR